MVKFKLFFEPTGGKAENQLVDVFNNLISGQDRRIGLGGCRVIVVKLDIAGITAIHGVEKANRLSPFFGDDDESKVSTENLLGAHKIREPEDGMVGGGALVAIDHSRETSFDAWKVGKLFDGSGLF